MIARVQRQAVALKGPIYILDLLAFAELAFFNLMYFLGERKNGIRDSVEKSAGCGILVKKTREYGIRTPASRPCCIYITLFVISYITSAIYKLHFFAIKFIYS